MQPRSVLVIESHAFQRAVLVKALMSLQIETVIAVENAALATEWIRRAEFIDIIFFDVTDGLINNHEFLQVASELNNVRSLVVCSDLQSDLYRSVIQMKSFQASHSWGSWRNRCRWSAYRRCCRTSSSCGTT